ncbi:hypothetical protein HK405_010805 [Cladochytrium tenue]|nr:hypothetical protein HK405_010805 [Cladochytrium tenue]
MARPLLALTAAALAAWTTPHIATATPDTPTDHLVVDGVDVTNLIGSLAAQTLACVVETVPSLEYPVSLRDVALLCNAISNSDTFQSLVSCMSLHKSPSSDLLMVELLPSVCTSGILPSDSTDAASSWSSATPTSPAASQSTTGEPSPTVATDYYWSASPSGWNATYSSYSPSSSASSASEETFLPVVLSFGSNGDHTSQPQKTGDHASEYATMTETQWSYEATTEAQARTTAVAPLHPRRRRRA